MDRPDAAAIRAWSPPEFNWAAAGYPAPAPGDPEPIALEKRVDWAIAEIETITGRSFDLIVPPPVGSALPNLVPVAEKATVLKVMTDVLGGSKAALQVMGQPWLRSFTAGSYSETRFSPAELSGTQGRGTERVGDLGPEPLATLLLILMTDEKRDEWIYLLTGRVAPAGTFVAPDWGGHHGVSPAAAGQGIEAWWPWSGGEW